MRRDCISTATVTATTATATTVVRVWERGWEHTCATVTTGTMVASQYSTYSASFAASSGSPRSGTNATTM